MSKLQDILKSIDTPAFLQWVAEMEHSEHEWTERNLAGGCRRCDIDWIKRQYHRHCILTRSLAEIVAEKEQVVDIDKLGKAMKVLAAPTLDVDGDELFRATTLAAAYMAYIKQPEPVKYVALMLADGRIPL